MMAKHFKQMPLGETKKCIVQSNFVETNFQQQQRRIMSSKRKLGEKTQLVKEASEAQPSENENGRSLAGHVNTGEKQPTTTAGASTVEETTTTTTSSITVASDEPLYATDMSMSSVSWTDDDAASHSELLDSSVNSANSSCTISS